MIKGEDANAYAALAAQFWSHVAPKDVIEQLWLRDIVEYVWEAQRLRRHKAQLMATAAPDGLRRVLIGLNGGRSTEKQEALVSRWARSDPRALKEVEDLLTQAGLGPDAIATGTFISHLTDFERIERMIVQAEGRRDRALRDIEHRRDGLARRLREAAEAIDAEFSELPAPGEGGA